MLEPSSEADLAEAIAGADGPLSVRGGGTRTAAPAPGETLSVAGLTGITLYEPGALTLRARAGTPLAEVEAALAAENQRLPFEPMDHRPILGTEGTPTIGGAVAVNASGPRRIVAGACRDSLIGVRFVDGAGTIVKNGGRVMKNVTGYDLVKLLAGSHGTLGVLSEVCFKVLPGVPARATLSVDNLAPERAVACMAAALGSPFEVSAAAHLPGDPARTHLRLEGFEASVAYRIERLGDLLRSFGDVAVERDDAAVIDLWEGIRDARPLVGADGDLWRISVRPSDAPRALAQLDGARTMMDWGGGLIWAAVAAGFDTRAALQGIGGHATRVRGADAQGTAFPPQADPVAAIAAGLRARFDPRGILNRGVMG